MSFFNQTNTIVPQDAKKRRMILIPLALVGLVAAGIMLNIMEPTRKKYQQDATVSTQAYGGLNNEFMLLPLLGFREAAAGLLWVRCDEFFHSGDYDAILPLVRLVTWLDPRADNVYVTGAWHLTYNFTDSSERSDRRYIAPGMALLDEGIKNNLHLPDIKFEKGWQCYDKMKDYIMAEQAYKLALAGPNGDGKGLPNSPDFPYAAPLKVHHMLAHAYEKQGRIPEALNEWKNALKRSDEMIKVKPDDFGVKSLRAAEQRNYNYMLQRYYNRYTSSNHDINNPFKTPAVRPSRNGKPASQWDVAFKPTIEVKRPKVFQISGRMVIADGARVFVRIQDWNFKNKVGDASVKAMEAPDLGSTILIDSISVRKFKFSREMDMSRDPKMYGFSNKEGLYRIVLSFFPRTTSPHLQDFTGWSGEGITDVKNPSRILTTQDPALNGTKMIEGIGGVGPVWDGKTIPWGQFGQPIHNVQVTYKITYDQVMGNKPITDKDIVPNDPTIPIQLY